MTTKILGPYNVLNGELQTFPSLLCDASSLYTLSSMAKWLLIYPLLSYEHISSAALSLPISRALTIVTVILPFVAAINAVLSPRLLRSTSSTTSRRVLTITLQALQAIVTTVVGTLLFSHMLPSAARRCLLETTWQRLFSAHDANSIRRIQDTFNCCGFNTVRDRPWPFPSQQTSRGCPETYGRDTACAGPWQMTLQRNSGLEFGVVLAVGFFQVASLFMAGNFNPSNAIPTRKVLQHLTENDTERTRLLPAVTGDIRGGSSSEHEVERNGQISETNVEGPGWRTESSHGNPWGSDQS
ncbi:Uncharacterized protein TPAR_07374 [Tolypocladium paradoxum]|uniref:Tetraspanin Tsp3 n=1 Tax=Tolypocladium paradoxum TaxID=94208 RepID=A0A2S4KQI2_9HYPO|nr:Uncharacterized protein TPAR_07374 [Tolypocladium paradoxum]